MKKALGIGLVFLLFLFGGTTDAEEVVEVRLTDGSVVFGELIAVNEGTYTVRTQSLGILEIAGANIRVIRLKPEGPGTEDPIKQPLNGEGIQSLQHSLMNNEELLGLILALQNEPQVQEILKDPVIVNALISQDMETLLSNPKILDLLKNPKVREIQKKARETDKGNP
jgi:hypothetical protein